MKRKKNENVQQEQSEQISTESIQTNADGNVETENQSEQQQQPESEQQQQQQPENSGINESEFKEPEKQPEPEKTEKKRGRPKKEVTQSEVESEVQSVQPNKKAAKELEQAKEMFISGYILLIIINAIMPNLFIWLLKKSDPKKYNSVKASEIMLDKEELKELKPIADEAAKYVSLNINPVALLIVSMGGMYFIKIQTYAD